MRRCVIKVQEHGASQIPFVRTTMPSHNQQQVLQLKEEADTFFKSGHYAEAAKKYTEAIALDSRSEILFANRAAAYLHLNR